MKLVAIPLYEGGDSVYINPEHVTHIFGMGHAAHILLVSGKSIMAGESAEKVIRRLTLPRMEAPP